ncbi:MAG: trypsin-like peptidase domain-containing protein [Proteobacteria bacterium]|nr:trypsin-like peptidase domain-containing protein [Pseudomonadota bacterium]
MIQTSASVLRVEAQRLQGGLSLGSGVVIERERVATNCHVTRDAEQIFVIRGGARWPVEAQAGDAYHDVCILRVPGLRAPAVVLGDSRHLSIGQPLVAVGYTGGVAIQSSLGEVVALHRMDAAQVVQTSSFFNSGASGGALFDEQLHLVGLLAFHLRGADGHYYAMPVEWLTARTAQAEAERPVRALGSTEIAFWQQPLAEQPAFLRADALAHEANWAELQPVARAWAKADAHDPEAWYMLALAFDGQNRAHDAEQALECSLAAEPTYAPALARLQPLYRQQGRPAAQAVPPCQL